MWLEEDDVEVLVGRADGDPAEATRFDVVAYFEAERVAVEEQRGVGIVDRNEHRGHGDCHDSTLRRPALSRFFDPAQPVTARPERRGRVATLLTHDGMSSWS